MPDLSTALVSAGAKPLVKIVLTFRPGKVRKQAAAAERQVTRLLFDSTAFIDEDEFAKLMSRRAQVDNARLKAFQSKWRKNGLNHVRITYQYYTSATTLLRKTEEVTDTAMRQNGPEGQRVSGGTGASADASGTHAVPVASGSITSLTIENVLLRPGDNLVRIPCPMNVPQVATLEIRMRAPDSGLAAGCCRPLDDSPAKHIVGEGENQAEEDDSEDDISVETSIRLCRRTSKQRRNVQADLEHSIEIDMTEADYDDS
ncbi:hypothetical protein OH77DRAFT_1435147 [Trametes cingulata]|nr:hypothetical protein OH77DRAFT_1435147 [Trametes cingulata]